MRKWIKWTIGIEIVSFVFLAVFSVSGCYTDYVYERDYLCHWNLADKSSTIVAKKQHMENFYNALNKSEIFASHNALIFKTDDNSYVKNMDALKTLVNRLTEIEEMSPSSFEYNTAIQQITTQEEGEADSMLSTISGCWFLENHLLFWLPIRIATIATLLMMIVIVIPCFWLLYLN